MTRGQKADVHAAALQILRRLVSWLIQEGIGFGTAQQILRVAYAQAGCDLAHPGKRPKQVNARKVADLTGLVRQNIRVLLAEQKDCDALSRTRSHLRAQRILWGWHNDRRFQNPDGTPALLPVQGPKNSKSFSELVRLHSGDTGFEAKLETLLQTKAVRQRADGRVEILRKTFTTGRMDAAGIAAFSQAITEHLNCLLTNADRPKEDQLYSRRIVSGELDLDAAYLLMNRLRERAEAFGDRIESDITDEVHAPTTQSRARHVPLVFHMYLSHAESTEKEENNTTAAASDLRKSAFTEPQVKKRKRKRAHR